MPWKFNSREAVFVQIASRLRGEILRGKYQPDQQIPPVRQLAFEAAVNPNTMQRALTELEREGLLIGCGTSGRKVTTEDTVICAMKDQMILALARDCAEKFGIFGVTPAQAAEFLRQLEM